jgi:hypothetical protein
MAFGPGTISSIGGAVQDLFGSEAHKKKAQGLRIEAENYDLASGFARQNERFAEVSTGLKLAQQDRENFKMLGGIEADVAGAGFSMSGSAIDILRDSAGQGALMKAVAETQGLITQEGYDVQAKSYTNMGEAARLAASAEEDAAEASKWSAGFKGAAAIASIFLK